MCFSGVDFGNQILFFVAALFGHFASSLGKSKSESLEELSWGTKKSSFHFFPVFSGLNLCFEGIFQSITKLKSAFIVVCTRVNKLKIVFEKWVFKDCLDTWPPRRVKKTFINRESSYFVEDVEILLIKIQMTDTILNLLLNLQRKFLRLTTWILLRTIHSFIHHFCAVAVLRKYKGLKKVRTKIIQSFPVIKVNIAFLKHIMNIL